MKKSDLVSVIGKGIRAERKRLKLTIEQLAEAADVDANFLSRVETGTKAPGLSLIAKVLNALDVEPATLFKSYKPAPGGNEGGDLERKIRILVRGLSRSQRLDLIAVLSRLSAADNQIKNLRQLLRV